MKNFKIFVSEPTKLSIILAAWLISCVIIFFFITLFWQLVLMFLTFLITGSYLVVTKLRYMHGKHRGKSVSNNYDAMFYILTVTMGVTCASTALITVVYVLSIPAKISESNSVDYLSSTCQSLKL